MAAPSTVNQEARGATAAEASEVAVANGTKPASREALTQAVSDVRKNLEMVARNLQFSIDDETGQTVVKVIDSDTREVIRQIPSEELLELAHSMDQKYSGLFVKQKA
ncbi:MAG: flagellar protein FlaG [Rhodocyclaceae bacterium]